MKRGAGQSSPRRSAARPTEAEREARIDAVPGLRARIAAHQVISDVIAGGHALDERFAPTAVPNRTNGLDARDKALVRSISTVAVRRLGAIRRAMGRLLDRGLPRNAGHLEWIMIVGLAQIFFMDTPDHAAVDLAVRAAKSDAKTAGFSGLLNACLRNAVRERDALLADLDPLTVETPGWLAQRWRRAWGEERARAIAAAHLLEPTLDLSVIDEPEAWAKRLGGAILPTGSLRIESHTPIPELEGFAEGRWWVQDAGAAIPARLLRARAGMRALELCAAPGGKTAQLAAAGADVVALDRSAERLKQLSANLARLDLHADVVVADAATWSAEPFDAVLVDPPCSATGTIRRHPDVQWTKKPGDVDQLAALQSRILDRAAALTKPGGTLVYCTCSIEPEEGELQIAALLRRNPDFRRDRIETGENGIPAEFITAEGELRTLPSYWPNENPRAAGVDGFYAARLRKQG
ncbi:MAG: MFS transporter [Hyphomicrobiales bacterium]|nr:MFS transporter [Hyphomicrobiales bacterium]